jgi:hypothetical protein
MFTVEVEIGQRGAARAIQEKENVMAVNLGFPESSSLIHGLWRGARGILPMGSDCEA